MPDNRNMYESNETADLIYASKVEGTAVYDLVGDHVGSIDDIVLTKRSGEVAYAVVSFGGFLGIGEKYHPLPWAVLDYDVGLGGYRVATAGETFRAAPSFSRNELIHSGWRQQTDDYYASAESRQWVADRRWRPAGGESATTTRAAGSDGKGKIGKIGATQAEVNPGSGVRMAEGLRGDDGSSATPGTRDPLRRDPL